MIEQKAARAGKEIHFHRKLCEGAIDRLMVREHESHDQMVLDGPLSLASLVDVIALAQASRTRMVPMLSE